MFYLYLQPSSASRQLKISNWMFFANPLYNHPNAWHLKTFQWHGWTRSSNNSIFLFGNTPIFRRKIFYLHLQSSSASRKWKNSNVVHFADLVHRVRRYPSVTPRKFLPNTTGHGLRITKRPAVWYFSIFLFEKYQFLTENIFSSFRILKCFEKIKKNRTLSFSPTPFTEYEEIQAWYLKKKKICCGFYRTTFKIL